MSEDSLFPEYITRGEEQQILEESAKVRADGQSRVVLLYGPGGIGKTSMVRRLAQAGASDPETLWVDPVDIDDSDYWLLSNLEQHVAERLDPDGQYFRPYMEYLSRLPGYTRSRIGYETVVSHLARIKQVFAGCYRQFINETGKTVVITLDTVEAIRGMYLLVTLTQWMKALPATLFILSGRPPWRETRETTRSRPNWKTRTSLFPSLPSGWVNSPGMPRSTTSLRAASHPVFPQKRRKSSST
jgi:hypothetical protein